MRNILALAAGVLVAAPLSAQVPASRLPITETTSARFLAPELIASLDLGLATAQSFELPARLVDDVARFEAIIAGEVHTVELWPHSMRDENFELLVQRADGSYESVEPAPIATVRGHLVDLPDSIVAGQILDGSLTATIYLGNGLPTFGIQPMRDVDMTAPASSHVVYDSGDRLPRDVTCGTDDMLAGAPSDGGTFLGTVETQVTDIAIDADTQFYNLNGSSVNNTQLDIENVMNGVEAHYIDDVGISYNITTIIVRTTEPDPYTTSSSGGLLGEFQNHWNSEQQAIQRDVAHLFTGKNLTGSTIGVAYLNTICSLAQAYGLSQSRFSNNYNSRVALTAHELGHNWSAPHCNGLAGCQIMCSGLGGCGGTGGFGPTAIGQITNKKNSAGCLVSSIPPDPPTITSINPSSLSTIQTLTITLTGTEFEQVESVTVGDTELTGNSVLIINGKAQFTAPEPSSLGTVPVTITNISGTSNSVNLTYTANEPPVVNVPLFVVSGQDFNWKMGGDAFDTGYLLVSLDGSTFPFGNDSILLNFLVLSIQPLGATGLASYTLNLPAAASGITLRSQTVVFNGNGYDDASPIKTTTIF